MQRERERERERERKTFIKITTGISSVNIFNLRYTRPCFIAIIVLLFLVCVELMGCVGVSARVMESKRDKSIPDACGHDLPLRIALDDDSVLSQLLLNQQHLLHPLHYEVAT